MGKIVAYLRASTDKQDLGHQKLALLEFAQSQALKIDAFIEITISSGKTSKQRRIDELLQTLNDADTLIVTELSRLGRSTAEIIALVNALIKRNIRALRVFAWNNQKAATLGENLIRPTVSNTNR